MLMQQKRLWPPRVDSRFILKALIGFNILLAVYHIFSLQTGDNKSNTPCVVVINTSNNNNNKPDLVKGHHKFSPNSEKTNSPEESNQDEHKAETSVPKAVPEEQEVKDKMFAESGLEVDTSLVTTTAATGSRGQSIWWTTESRGSYSVIRDYIPGDLEVGFNDSVTLTTQGTFEFLHHSESLCKRWDGPISLAVYAPGDDFKVAVELINFLRICRDSCVKRNISWHLVFDAAYGPPLSNISFPEIGVSLSVNCSLSNDELLERFKSTFRAEHKTPYPINVVRNVARLGSQTKYLLASDIELFPSLHIVSMFKELLRREDEVGIPFVSKKVPHVYVLPIFEVKAGFAPPASKRELVRMVKKGDAIFFHKWVCDSCQNFPDRDKWVDFGSENDTLSVFRGTKRLRNRNAWEPLYIGSNAEPLYDERLTWDGKRDKMSQMYEMCLMNYDLAILDNAFLVHAPGIKHIDPKDQRRRLPFIKRNNAVYNTIISKLKKKYGSSSKC